MKKKDLIVPCVDRISFEEKIMKAWHVVDDIKLVRRALESGVKYDELDNLLLGMEVKYNFEFNEILDEFEELVRSRQFK